MSSDPESVALMYLDAVGQKRFERIAELLDPEVEFEGPNMCLRGAREFVGALRRIGPILARNDLRKAFVDGRDVALIYHFVTDTAVGAIPCVEWLTIDGGRIRQVRLIFHTAVWPAVVAELNARMQQPA